jgi:hypothetical protein
MPVSGVSSESASNLFGLDKFYPEGSMLSGKNDDFDQVAVLHEYQVLMVYVMI